MVPARRRPAPQESVILHKRTATRTGGAERKRHLLRLWLAAPDFDDGDEQLRGGIAMMNEMTSGSLRSSGEDVETIIPGSRPVTFG